MKMSGETQKLATYNGSSDEQKTDDDGDVDVNELYANEDIVFRKDGESIDVGIHTYVYRIDNINLVDQSFDALFYCTLSWKPTKKEWESYQNDPLNYEPTWTPPLTVPNGAGVNMQIVKGNKDTGYKIAKTGLDLNEHPFGRKIGKLRTSDNKGYNLYNTFQYSIECSINERYELENFPFDCQELKIIIEGTASTDVFVLKPSLIDPLGITGGLSIKFSNCQEFLVKPPLTEYKTIIYPGIDPQFSVHIFNIKLQRKWKIYFFKYFTFNFVITGGALFSFSNLVGDKLDYLVTLLLTQVAYQFVLATTLPNLPYLTILDKYVSFGFIYIFIIMVFILSFSAAYDIEEEASKFQYALYILIGIFIIFHIYIAIVIILALKYETKKLDLSTIQLANAGYEDNTEQETFITDEIHTIISQSTLNFMKNKNGMELLSKTDDG